MSESTARQLFELTFAFLTGAAMGTAQLPVYALQQIFPGLAALWDAFFYALAGMVVFAAGQWCSGGVHLRFLTASVAGWALCAYLLSPLRRRVCLLAERKREHREERRRRKEEEREKARKKDEKN